MEEQIYKWMEDWTKLVNQSTPVQDYWVETPIGSFKNLKFIPNKEEEDLESPITINMTYDVWKDL